MWFHLGCQDFIAKKTLNNEFCDVFISDFIRIWHKTLANDEIISISQTLNPLLEASVQKLRDITLNSLEDVKTQKVIKEENNKITLKLESKILGLKFLFQFFKEFTLPLLILLKNVQNQEKKLMKIMETKDEEIAEYKKECTHIKSRYMTTKPFTKKEFSGNESESIPWDLGSFLNSIKFLSTEKLCEVEQMQSVFEDKEEKSSQMKKCDKTQSACKDKNITRKIGSKLCVSLDNQIVNKKKKNALKLKF